MNIHIKGEKVKYRELKAAEKNLDASIELISRFLVDDEGKPIPQEEAMLQLEELNLIELRQAQTDFLTALNQAMTSG